MSVHIVPLEAYQPQKKEKIINTTKNAYIIEENNNKYECSLKVIDDKLNI